MAISENIKTALQALEDEACRARVLADCLRTAPESEHDPVSPWVYQIGFLADGFHERVQALCEALHEQA